MVVVLKVGFPLYRKMPENAIIYGVSRQWFRPKPRDKTKRCKAIVSRKPDKLSSTILMQRHTRTLACLSLYFDNGFIRASTEIGERPFPFYDGCVVVVKEDKRKDRAK